MLQQQSGIWGICNYDYGRQTCLEKSYGSLAVCLYHLQPLQCRWDIISFYQGYKSGPPSHPKYNEIISMNAWEQGCDIPPRGRTFHWTDKENTLPADGGLAKADSCHTCYCLSRGISRASGAYWDTRSVWKKQRSILAGKGVGVFYSWHKSLQTKVKPTSREHSGRQYAKQWRPISLMKMTMIMHECFWSPEVPDEYNLRNDHTPNRKDSHN